MKLTLKILTIIFVTLLGCTNKFNQFEQKPKPTMEKIVYDGLETWAKNATVCKEKKLELVHSHESLVRDLVAQVKDLATDQTQGVPKINLTALQAYAKSSSDQPDRLVFEIITSDNFETVLTEMSRFLTKLANDPKFTHSLTAIQHDLTNEAGNRIAESIHQFAAESVFQNAMIGTIHSLMCKNPSGQDLQNLVLFPQLLWSLSGPNGIYLLMYTNILEHAKQVALALKEITPSRELENFFVFLHEMSPQHDVCSIENLDAYERPLSMVEYLLKAPQDPTEQRPLRKFLNLMFRLHSMDDTNQCRGTSFDDLKSENIQQALLQAADFLTNKQSGVISFLQKIKP